MRSAHHMHSVPGWNQFGLGSAAKAGGSGARRPELRGNGGCRHCTRPTLQPRRREAQPEADPGQFLGEFRSVEIQASGHFCFWAISISRFFWPTRSIMPQGKPVRLRKIGLRARDELGRSRCGDREASDYPCRQAVRPRKRPPTLLAIIGGPRFLVHSGARWCILTPCRSPKRPSVKA